MGVPHISRFEPASGDLPVNHFGRAADESPGGKSLVDEEDFEIARAQVACGASCSLGGLLGNLKKCNFTVERSRVDTTSGSTPQQWRVSKAEIT